MPTYLYEYINPDGSSGEQFEHVQRMSDPPLEAHPESGRPVRRVPTAPNIGGRWTEGGTRNALSDSNLERLGFAKYQNEGGGRFGKRAGAGPDQIGV